MNKSSQPLGKVLGMDVLKVVKRNPLIFPMACVAVIALIFISEGSLRAS